MEGDVIHLGKNDALTVRKCSIYQLGKIEQEKTMLMYPQCMDWGTWLVDTSAKS